MGTTKSCDENGSETVDVVGGAKVIKGVFIDSGSSCNTVDQSPSEELKRKVQV